MERECPLCGTSCEKCAYRLPKQLHYKSPFIYSLKINGISDDSNVKYIMRLNIDGPC